MSGRTSGNSQSTSGHDEKNAKLRKERGIGFEDVVFHIERGDPLDILEPPNPKPHSGQRILVVRREPFRPSSFSA